VVESRWGLEGPGTMFTLLLAPIRCMMSHEVSLSLLQRCTTVASRTDNGHAAVSSALASEGNRMFWIPISDFRCLVSGFAPAPHRTIPSPRCLATRQAASCAANAKESFTVREKRPFVLIWEMGGNEKERKFRCSSSSFRWVQNQTSSRPPWSREGEN